MRPRARHDPIAREHRVHGERPDAEHVVLAHEQGRPVHAPAGPPEPFRHRHDRVRHLPGARRTDRGAHGGLDAVRRADPPGEGDEPRAVGPDAVVRHVELPGHELHRDPPLRPPQLGPAPHPLEHQVRHVGGRDDVVCRLERQRAPGGAEERVEKGAPLGRHERAVRRRRQLAARSAPAVAIHDDHRPEVRLPPLLGLGELGRVERAVAAATHDDHVPHADHAVHRISLPPSTTRTLPLT